MKVNKLLTEARKFLVALIAALGVLATALSSGSVTNSEWIQIGIAFVGALGVYTVTNVKSGQ